ncbi:secreted protein [Candidatus Omnitrophus magneticus]|uniref:Secreted protein n=1 Tax=Candidatus Omnitrophus magneticus TaxID=1609969 RepID=A0A0F0CJ25_9BACT|nr:secreted protein [Candidatus Omnitrophus magneticus]
MKKILFYLMAGAILLSASYSLADNVAEMKDLSTQLSTGGVKEQDINSLQGSMKNMLQKGANKEDVKNVILQLVKLGIQGKELTTSVQETDKLLNEGKDIKTASSIVSQAVAAAHAKGLKGQALSKEIHKAIALKKAQHAKEKAEKVTAKAKEKAKEKETKK